MWKKDPLESISKSAGQTKGVETASPPTTALFTEASQKEWREQFEFPTGIYSFPHVNGKYTRTLINPSYQR